MAGGGAAAVGRNWVERVDGSVEELTATDLRVMQPGDVFVIETPGGGGFGPEEAGPAEAGQAEGAQAEGEQAEGEQGKGQQGKGEQGKGQQGKGQQGKGEPK
jgi:N-methylhydantoinase B/oxoprolinase/acetone carboxylase alpha subunit